MKSQALRLLAAVAVVAIAATGFAQQRGGMMMRGGGDSGIGLLMRKDVQDDLALTAEQKTKIEAIQTKASEQMRAKFQEMRDSGGDFQSMRGEMEKMMAGVKKEAMAVLTETQAKRAKEIQVQLQGNRAILDAAIQKDLGLSEEQKAKVKKIQDDQQAGMQQMRQDMQDGSMSREEMQAAMQKRQTAMGEELGKILTAGQAAKLKEMGGSKPFKKADKPG